MGREGRAQHGHPSLALDRRQQGGLFTADKRPGAFHYFERQAMSAAEYVLAQQAAFHANINRLTHATHRQRILRADVQIPFMGTNRSRRDDHALDHAIWIRFEDHTVHERARVALVTVADDVLGLVVGIRHRPPLDTRGESRSTAPSQTAVENCFDGFIALGVGEYLFHRIEAAVGDVLFDVNRVDVSTALGGDVFLSREEVGDGLVAGVYRPLSGDVPCLVVEHSIDGLAERRREASQ